MGTSNFWTWMHFKAKWPDTCACKVEICWVGWTDFGAQPGILKVVVLLCNRVKINYRRNSVTMKKNKYDLKLLNFAPLIPILDQFFISPLHVEQVCFSYRPKWKGLEVCFMEWTPREACYKNGNYWWVLTVTSSSFY